MMSFFVSSPRALESLAIKGLSSLAKCDDIIKANTTNIGGDTRKVDPAVDFAVFFQVRGKGLDDLRKESI